MVLVKEAVDSNFEYIPQTCPHCGVKEDQVFNSYFRGHTEKCRLEQLACNCAISFKTPWDKIRHTKLHHLNQKYFQCTQCDEIFGDNQNGKEVLKRHTEFNHSNKQVCCEICTKSFKNENNLQVHRMTHELYFCQVSDIEILGRNPHKSHRIKKHGAELNCDSCDRIFYA